ncbi:MAG: hypothetical protein ABW079_03715 [Sedimenticola sp.]
MQVSLRSRHHVDLRRVKTRFPGRRQKPDSGRLNSRPILPFKKPRVQVQGQFLSSASVSVCGRPFADCHPGFAPFIEELFFHTSRYYRYTESYLQQLAGSSSFCMAGFRAARMSDRQRDAMANLLSHPPSEEIAGEIIKLVGAVISGDRGVDRLDAPYRTPRQVVCREPLRVEGKPRAGPDIDVREQLLHFAQRFNLNIDICGSDIRLSLCQLERILKGSNPTTQSLFTDISRRLRDLGFRLCERGDNLARKYDWN